MYVYTDGYFGEVLVRSLQKNTSAISLQHNWRKKEGGGGYGSLKVQMALSFWREKKGNKQKKKPCVFESKRRKSRSLTVSMSRFSSDRLGRKQ